MAVRNQNWYDLNESRLWPFDDQAQLTDDRGLRLPNDLIADIYLRYPSQSEARAFVGALTVGPTLVTLIVLISGHSPTPIAAVTLKKPVSPRRHYEFTPLLPGTGGWVVFGSGIDDQELRSYRFSDPLQTLLLAQTARPYRRSPVPGIGKLFGDQSLTGVVRLQGGNDIVTAVEEREIAGVVRDVIVIKLAEGRNLNGQRNLLEEYAGTCGQRPESLNCGGPDPIQGINAVTPDCCNNIFIEFRGHGEIKGLANECGVLIDVGIGLSESCVTPDRLPDEYGRLPNEYADLCEDAETSSPTTVAPDDLVYEPTSRPTTTGLPYLEDFSDLVAQDLNSRSGSFLLTDDSLGPVLETQEDRTNLIVWDEGLPQQPGWDALYKRVSTTLSVRTGAYAAKNNGGLLFNYVDDRNYFRAEVDMDLEKCFRLVQVTNGALRILGTVPLAGLAPGNRYDVRVDVVPLNPTANAPQAIANAKLTGLDDDVHCELNSVLLPRYAPGTGLLGLWSDRSLTWFEKFEVEHYSP